MHMRLHIKTDTNLDNLFPYIFFHNGTDVDRLGENILGRELVSGKHDVSNWGNRYPFHKKIKILVIVYCLSNSSLKLKNGL